MKQFVLFLLFTLLTIAPAMVSCNKDEFPDEFVLTGRWIEVTDSTFKAEIEFLTGNRVFLSRWSDVPRDTLNYRLEKKDELKLYLPADYPDGTHSTHQLKYSRKTEHLTIYNLYPTNGLNASETVFERW
ncbi:MAG: hypothetical protein JNL22_01785 [Bacteroidales bacterium]|nr:hypothetical protein [Bacteroidales bacterium]